MRTTLAGPKQRSTYKIASLWVIGIFTLLAGQAHAVDPSWRLTQYAHTSWRVQDGIFRGSPNALTQTADGYLWIGTLSGVYRFDGVSLLLASFAEEAQMRSPRVISLFSASDGSLWIGTGSDLEHWQDGQLTHFPETLGFIAGIAESAGHIWFTRDRTPDLRGALCRVDGEHSLCFGNEAGVSIPASGMGGLPQDESGHLWFGDGKEVFIWDPRSAHVIKTVSIPGTEAEQTAAAVAFGVAGRVFIGSQQSSSNAGLMTYDGVAPPQSFVARNLNLANESVRALLRDRHGTLWVGTDSDGLYRVVDGRVDQYRESDGLSGNSINALFEDREGNIWIATAGGLDRFRDLKIASYSTREGLSSDVVSAVLARRDGSVWISNYHSLDALKDGKVSSMKLGTGLPGEAVMALFEDHSGVLWLGIEENLFVYDQGRFTKITDAQGKSIYGARSITEDQSAVWVLDNLGRLFEFKNRKAVHDWIDGDKAFPVTPAIAPDRNGGVWLPGKNMDFLHVEESKVTRIAFHRTPGAANVYSMIATEDGAILAGSAIGVAAVKEGRAQTLGVANGLPCPHVWSLIEDEAFSVWLYTECGLVMIEHQEWDKWWKDPSVRVQSKVISSLEGALPANAFFTPTAARSKDGQLWFANSSVLQTLTPAALKKPPFTPTILIETLHADQSSYAPAALVKLPPKPKRIEIDYTSPTFGLASMIRFRYRLGGYEDSWVDAGTRRQAFYSDLPPGRYQFEVAASDSDGAWSGPSAQLNLAIAPTFFQTKCFLGLCIALAAVIIWLLYLLRVRQISQRIRLQTEARSTERERIARDLHDTLLQGMQGLIYRFQANAEKLPTDNPVRVEMIDALDRADAMVSEGREQIIGLRQPILPELPIEEALKQAASALAKGRQATLQFFVRGDARTLAPLARDEAFRIGIEALENAFRHSNASEIEVEVLFADDHALITIRDNGCGFEPNALQSSTRDGHFGVLGMRERAARLDARLEITSRPAAGTIVSCRIPAAIAYGRRFRRRPR